jgi:hypothetical protein
MAIDGNIYLGDLSGGDTPFLLDGSFSQPLPLPLYQLAATGDTGQALEAYGPVLQLEAFTGNGGMADGLVLRRLQLAALGVAGESASADLALPAFDAAGALTPALALAPLTLSASASAGTIARPGILALPPYRLAAQAIDHAGLALPAFDVTGDAAAGTLARGQVQLAAWSLAASSYRDTSASGDSRLPLLQLQAIGRSDSALAASITLNPLQLAASAVNGSVSSAALTVPLYAIAATGYGEAIGNATLLLPAFSVRAFTVRLTRPVTAAIVLNTRLKGVVRYDGLAANSFASFAGLTLAATPDGIVALMGDTDLGFPIEASVVSGTSDLGVPQRKRIEAGYVGYRAGGEMEMTLITDEHHEYTYRLAPRQIPNAVHSTRVKFGRGVDGNFWQWKLANLRGGAFDLASMQLNVIPLARSV